MPRSDHKGAVVTHAACRQAETETQPATGTLALDAIKDETHRTLMLQVEEAVKRGDFIGAKTLLSFVRNLKKPKDPSCPEDPYIVQRLALLTYKSKHPTEAASLQEARSLLSSLAPDTSNDTETLGLWGAVHKRLWNLNHEKKDLDEAVRACERGFYLRNDHYNGINVAFLLNIRAARRSSPRRGRSGSTKAIG